MPENVAQQEVSQIEWCGVGVEEDSFTEDARKKNTYDSNFKVKSGIYE